MKKYILLLLLLTPLLDACRHSPRKTNWGVSLNHEGKSPYDTWLAYESLPWYFPHARREAISRSFRYTSIDNHMMSHPDDSAALLVMTGLDYYVSDEEWTNIKAFAEAGNEVFILCSRLDNKIEAELKCKKFGGAEDYPLGANNNGTANNKLLSLLPDKSVRYGYTGRMIDGIFKINDTADKVAAPDVAADSSSLSGYSNQSADEGEKKPDIPAPTVLGECGHDDKSPDFPDFIRYTIGNGHITLHAAPLVLSNYFLLQPGNRSYLDGIWHAFPDNINRIYWNDYYKRSTEGSSLGVLWRYPATRWALIIAIFTLIVYVLLGLRRRQRIIPVIRPLENASVSFVETIGRLYFNKGNHANLAEKMIQHFLEWVRTYYFLDTSKLNDVFAQQLAAKSGKGEEAVQALLTRIHEIRLGSAVVTQEYLFALYNTLQSFYNNQSS